MQSSLVRIPSRIYYTYSFESYWVWSCMFNSHHISSISTDFFGQQPTNNTTPRRLFPGVFNGCWVKGPKTRNLSGRWLFLGKTWIMNDNLRFEMISTCKSILKWVVLKMVELLSIKRSGANQQAVHFIFEPKINIWGCDLTRTWYDLEKASE